MVWIGLSMTFSDLWDVDMTDVVKNRTWWWWWWLYFFDNPDDPQRPLQLMVLWATRNAQRVRIDDVEWQNEGDIVRKDGEVAFGGMSGAWLYDGKKMHDPLFLEKGNMRTVWDDSKGSLIMESTSKGSTSKSATSKESTSKESTSKEATSRKNEFTGKPDEYKLAYDNGDVKLDLLMTPWTDWMGGIVPTGKKYLGKFSYRMLKIRGMKAGGTIEYGGNKLKVKGTTYFQKVRINSPTSPWYWAVLHSPKGSFIDYFMPHLGLSMFRGKHAHKTILDRGEKHISRSFQFYDHRTDKLHKVKNVKMKKRYENDLPIFTLGGFEDGKRVLLEMTTYSRACKEISQPLMGLFKTTLFYNEYPAFVTRFEYEDEDGLVTLKDIGPMFGNCEHAWGIV